MVLLSLNGWLTNWKDKRKSLIVYTGVKKMICEQNAEEQGFLSFLETVIAPFNLIICTDFTLAVEATQIPVHNNQLFLEL